jgi:hypothetical protein
MAAFKTSKLLIIPLINHQHQPLDRISTPTNTLRNKFSCNLVGDKDLITSPKQPPSFENQNHTTYLLFYSSFNCSIARFPLNTFHLATPLPHNHPASSSNTHIPNRRKQHKDFNAIKHHRISIQCSSLFPCCWK